MRVPHAMRGKGVSGTRVGVRIAIVGLRCSGLAGRVRACVRVRVRGAGGKGPGRASFAWTCDVAWKRVPCVWSY